MVLQVLEVPWYPTSVHNDALFFTVGIKMCVERNKDLHSFLSSEVQFFDLNLFLVVEDATDSHGFHRPLPFELVQVFAHPYVFSFVRRGNVFGFFLELLLTSLTFVILIVGTSVLIFSCLVHEHCRSQINCTWWTYPGQGLLLP